MLWRRVLLGLMLVAMTANSVAADHNVAHDVLGGDPDDPAPSGSPLAEAQNALPEVEAPDTPADSLLESILSGAGSVVSDVGSALKDGVLGAAGALGDFFVAVATAIGEGAVWAVTTLGVGTWTVVTWSVTAVFGIMTATVTGGIRLVGTLATSGWVFLEDAALGLARLRPEGMSEAAWAGTVATGATAMSAAANLGLLSGLKKFGWLGAGAAPLFSRIAKDDILDHPLRSEIFDAIKSNPGIHISELARTVDAGWGTTIHHLRKLQEKELVAVRMVNNQKCYFQNGGQVSRSAWTQLPELKNDTANRIAQFILHHPLSPVTSISDALALSPSLVSHHVRKLERAGVVEKIRDGRFVKLSVTDSARATVFGGEAVGSPATVPAGVAA